MTFNGWLQIAIYAGSGDPHHQAVRRLHDARLRGRAHAAVAGAAPDRASASTSCAASNEREEQHWLSYAIAMLAFSFAGFVVHVRAAASAERAAVQSAGSERGLAGPGLQHLGQLRHQHQLAVVRARDDDELSHADGRAHGAQLRLGGHRHRARHRADPRLRPAFGAQHRQFLGRSDPLRALHPAADLDRCRAAVHRPRHAART